MFVGLDLNPPFQPTASRVACELSRQFIEKGNEVSIVTSGSKEVKTSFEDGIEIIQAPFSVWNSKLNENLISRIISERTTPDIVNGIGGFYSMFDITRTFRNCTIPYLFTLTTGGFSYFGIRKYGLLPPLEFAMDMGRKKPLVTLTTLSWSNFMLKTVMKSNLKGVITPSNRLRNICHLVLNGKETNKQLFCIPFGVNTSRFHPGRQSSATKPIILYFGHANRHRGFGTLLRAMRLVSRKISEACLHVYTPSRPAPYAHNDSSIKVHIGVLEKIEQKINEASIAVFPFHFAIPELPLTVLESMSASKATVTTSILGLPEVINDCVNGFIVEPYDVKALSERIVSILLNPDLRRNLGDSARESVLDLDWKKVAQRFMKVYQHATEDDC